MAKPSPRPPPTTKKGRKATLFVYLAQPDFASLCARADAEGLSLSAYSRRLILRELNQPNESHIRH